MLIAGASGHAAELLGVIEDSGYKGSIVFYDDLSTEPGADEFNGFRLLRSITEAETYFTDGDKTFCLGIGNPAARQLLAERLRGAGGELTSIVSPGALIGTRQVTLGEGLNIMPGAVITTRTRVGVGTLVHICVSIHHDSVIGDYCELSPGCRILGGATVGNLVSVGTNAVVMRNVRIGDRAVIGAGAVVTRDVPSGAVVKGVPAR